MYFFLVDDIVYIDFIHNNHIYELPANSARVWVGDPHYPYANPDFQMRRLDYGPRTEALKYGLFIKLKNKTEILSFILLFIAWFLFILISV